MVMQYSISQCKVFKIVEWILYIGLCIVSGWFASGVLQKFFSNQTSFSQHEEKVSHYPVLTMVLYLTATELKTSDVEIKYYIAGMTTFHHLKIGENLLYNDKYNKTEKVILDSPQDFYGLRVFRIIQTTQIIPCNCNLQQVGIELYHNVKNKTKSLFSESLFIYITSQQNSPGFTYRRWKDGKPLANILNKNKL